MYIVALLHDAQDKPAWLDRSCDTHLAVYARAFHLLLLLCRGYGGSAQKTFALLKEGKTDYKQSGRLGFPEGSFANGGAMRIAPVGLAYR